MISEVYNMDCMEYMKTIPDKFFDIAIVDPPYGDGNTLNVGGVLEQVRSTVRQVQVSTINGRIAENQTERGVTRTGGQWAAKYSKKLFRGTLRRGKNTSKNFSASHVTRLSGAAITLHYHQRAVL